MLVENVRINNENALRELKRGKAKDILNDDHGATAGMADLIIAKHRSGGVGEVRMRFVSDYVRFENPSELSGLESAIGMPQNTAFDQQGGTMIVDSKMNEDIAPDGDVPF